MTPAERRLLVVMAQALRALMLNNRMIAALEKAIDDVALSPAKEDQ